MMISPGDKLGPYETLSLLGAVGMGARRNPCPLLCGGRNAVVQPLA